MKKLVFVLCILSSLLSQAQPAVDSLRSLLILKKAASETEHIDILIELAYQLRVSEPDISLNYAKEALTAASAISYAKGESLAHIIIGDYYFVRAEYEKSLERGLTALRILEDIKDKTGLMHCYFILGSTYEQLKDTVKSDNYLSKTLAVARELNNHENMARVYNAQGLILSVRRKDPDIALPYWEKALKLVENDDYSVQRVFIQANLGDLYAYRGDIVKGLEYLEQAMRLAKLQNNKIGEVLITMQFGDVYKNNKEFERAEEMYKKTEKMARKLGARRLMQNAYISLIDVKLRTGKNQEAHEYQKKYAMTRDSIFAAEKAQQVAELEARFDTEKKEQAIRLLEQERRIENIWIKVLIIGVVLAAITSVFIYRLQLSRTRKANQLLEVEQVLNDKLKEMDRLKTQFFTTISHEFRTPLTLILAPLENELKKKTSAEGKETLFLIRRNANRLLELVNQLLDLSKLESGKMGLHVKHGDVGQFLSVMASSFDSLAENKEVEFVKQVEIDEGPYWFDQDKMEKIITNLLANAFKNTSSGGTVTTSMKVENNTLTIVVSDTGAGIPKAEQANVFSPFYQTRQAITSSEPGTGLGLSLVKELVKLYSGTITLQSEPGKGTTFTVTVPVDKNAFTTEQILEDTPAGFLAGPSMVSANQPGKVQLTEPTEALLNGKDSVLIVEDHKDMRDFMSVTLQNKDYAVFTASDGQEALHLARKYVPSLVLSDLMMPNMDGMELTRKIRDDERTSHIPVILLTAKNEQQAKLEGLMTGADDYLTKPFSPDELMVRISNLIEQRKKLAKKFRERILVEASPSAEISLDDKFLNRARAVIESNLGDPGFTVEKMADEMNLSRTQLLRKLKALTGVSPNDFIKDIRLKRAAEMIRHRADTITQIGYTVGFNDQSYFTKCFKKQFGVTPSEYSVQFVPQGNKI